MATLPLHYLFHAFNIQPSECETIAPAICPPNEDSVTQLRIAGTREESKEDDVEDRVEVCIYSDGSGVDGSAGAAAVLFWDGLEVRSVRYQLGSLTQHTTYEAEVIGVLLALELLHQEWRVHTASIKLDNQAVIQALGMCSTKPVQSLLNMVHDACKEWTADDR